MMLLLLLPLADYAYTYWRYFKLYRRRHNTNNFE